MNNDNFLIEESDLELAREVCNLINDSDLRNQSVANVAAANFAEKYFDDIEIDTESGIHNISQVLEDLNISDIYIKDNYIDVRLYFNENEIFVPKSHFDNNILPIAYMFIKVTDELSNGSVSGFIHPSSIDTSVEYNGFYRVPISNLISFYDIESFIVNKFNEDLPDEFDSLIFDFLDGKLSKKSDFYKILIDSKDARTKLKNAAKAKNIFDFISIPTEDSKETTTDIDNNETELLVEESTKLEEFLPEESDTFDIINEEAQELSFEDSLSEELEPLDAEDTSFDITESVEIAEDESDIGSLELAEYEEIESLDSQTDDNLESAEILEESSGDEQSDMYKLQTFEFAANESLEEEEEEEIKEESEQEFPDINEFSETENNTVKELTIEEDDTNTFGNIEDIETETVEQTVVNSFEPNIEYETDNSIEATEDTEDTKPAGFNFSTNITPSLETLDQDSQAMEDIEDDLLNSLENESVTQPVDEPHEQNEAVNASEQIDTLFSSENIAPVEVQNKNKSNNKLLPVLGIIAIVIVIAVYCLPKFTQHTNTNNTADNTQNAFQPVDKTIETTTPVTDAMPVETVENLKLQLNTNEGNSIVIPSAEQNIDTSIAISNLHVEFEIPSGYTTSKTAERYFTKMGKIIQLNLKTELLLLSKQPVTNKISVELVFDKDAQKFNVQGIVSSSGDKNIDDLIVRTVKDALDINLNMNVSGFGNIAGNPVLVIKL